MRYLSATSWPGVKRARGVLVLVVAREFVPSLLDGWLGGPPPGFSGVLRVASCVAFCVSYCASLWVVRWRSSPSGVRSGWSCGVSCTAWGFLFPVPRCGGVGGVFGRYANRGGSSLGSPPVLVVGFWLSGSGCWNLLVGYGWSGVVGVLGARAGPADLVLCDG